MADISQCSFAECPKSSSCLRFLVPEDNSKVYMRFYNICRESNNFLWYWEVVKEFVKKEDDASLKE